MERPAAPRIGRHLRWPHEEQEAPWRRSPPRSAVPASGRRAAGGADLSEVKVIAATARPRSNNLRLRRGDILFNEGGDRDKLGRGCVWNGELRNASTRATCYGVVFVAMGRCRSGSPSSATRMRRRPAASIRKARRPLASISIGREGRFAHGNPPVGQSSAASSPSSRRSRHAAVAPERSPGLDFETLERQLVQWWTRAEHAVPPQGPPLVDKNA